MRLNDIGLSDFFNFHLWNGVLYNYATTFFVDFLPRGITEYMSLLMRLWYLSHRRPAKAQASLRIRAVSTEPSLFAHMKYGNRRKVRINIRHLAPLDGCACAFKK